MRAVPDDRRTTPSQDPIEHDWVVRVSRDAIDVQIPHGQPAGDADLQVLFAGQLYDTPDVGAGTGIALVPEPAVAIARAFRERGEALLPSLRGRFAFVVVDRAARTIRAVRDPLGAHPLFYARTARDVVFSTSAARLRREPGVSPELNRAAIADHLCKRWIDPHETFFEHVRRVPPGWQARVTPAGLSLDRYWNPSGDRIAWLPDEEVERFDAVLEQAVARGLAAGPTSIFLSGGFDSVSVAAVAADLATRANALRPLALSLAFPDPSSDERAIQTSVARTLGLPLHIEGLHDAAGPRGLLAAGLELNRDLPTPLFNSWMPAYVTLAAHARAQGSATILTGEGGDQWLLASSYLAADLIARANIRGLAQLARTWRRSYRLSRWTAFRDASWTFGLRPLAGAICARFDPAAWDDRRAERIVASRPAWIAPDAALRDLQRARARAALPEARPAGGFYERECRSVLTRAVEAWQFEEQHDIGRRLGVRYVHPYWDADLIGHLYRVRPERLNQGGRTKALVRRTIDRRFPALGFQKRQKVEATDVFAGILRTQGPPLSATLDDFSALASLGVVQAGDAKRFVDASWGGSPRTLATVWNLINTEHWARRQLA
jgi:asparagine synthetase B (glutamine-hydrolysing)